ncbi:MAG: EscU/YscU/HrcU family type III secretion system export apparatus switch protein [Deltaproteobacteria bacterium]|nr:EscU/YscU/HrcU family type III secretion system export apparatus switch protein [Deltaproteobacteria bacterium]
MAEDSSPDDKTFDPTPKRLRQFREDGKVAVSRDLASTIQLLAVVIAFLVVGQALLAALSGSLVWVLTHLGDAGGRELGFGEAAVVHLRALMVPTATLCGILIVATIAAYFGQTKGLFATKSLGFKWERVAPLKRLADIFNPKQGTIRVLLAVAKLGFATLAVMLVLAQAMPEITALALGTIDGPNDLLEREIWRLLLVTVALLAVVATLDYIWQRRRLAGQLRMTREEVQRETEDEEGKPMLKQRRRQKHRELSNNRILAEVPKADVVLTNPTHVAVAIAYRPGEHRAPIVVAKGAEDLASQIRAVARRSAVPIIEHRALARTLFRNVKVGGVIPSSTFQAVAEILARVFKASPGRRPTRRASAPGAGARATPRRA